MRRMRGLLKFLFSLILLALIVGAAAWFWAGRMDGPAIEIRQPGKFIGQASTLEMIVQAPGGKFSRVDVGLEQGGKTYPVFAVNPDAPAAGQGPGRPADRHASDRQARDSRSEVRSSADRRARGTASALGTAPRRIDHDTRRAGAAGAADGRRALHLSLHQPRRQRVRRIPGDARGRAGRRPRRRQGIPRVPRVGCRDQRRSSASRCVLRAALRSADRHEDRGIRPRRGRQSGCRAARLPCLPEAVQEEPHRNRRPLPSARRPGDRVGLARRADSN